MLRLRLSHCVAVPHRATVRILILVAFILSVLTSSEGKALIIDSFEDGAYSFGVNGDTASVQQEGLSSALEGRRRTTLSASDDVTLPANVVLALTPGDDSVVVDFDYNGVPHHDLFFTVQFEWGLGGAVVNLLEEGRAANASDGIVITVSQATDAEMLTLVVHTPGSVSVNVPMSGPGELFIPFSDFATGDLTQVIGVSLYLNRFVPDGIPHHFSFGISDIRTTVPEPSTALLLASGLAAMAVRRRGHVR